MRAFLALEPDPPALVVLKNTLRQLRTSRVARDVKSVGEDNLHMTMRFLGEIDDAQKNKLADLLSAQAPASGQARTLRMLLMKDAASGNIVEGLFPNRDYYPVQQHTATIPFITGTFNNEIYVLLAGWENNGATASFQVYVNPLINWIWVGGVIVIIGFFVAFWPMPEKEPSAVRAVSRRVAGALAK